MKLVLALLLSLLCCAPASATISTNTASTIVLGTGGTIQFQFNFIGVAAAYIGVTYTDPNGVQTTLSQGTGPTQYQVTLNAPLVGQQWGIGGTITYNPGGTPIPNGSSITIQRTLPLLQAVSLQNQSSYGQVAKSAEKAVDLLEMQLQQVSQKFSYVITANASNLVPPASLPPAAQAAGFGLCFDSSGLNLIACAVLPMGVVSSAMQPIVGAVSVAAAQTLFGLGTAGRENIGAGLQDDGSGNLRTITTLSTNASNTTVTAAFHQTAHVANGPFTYTLPRASSLFNGFDFTIYPSGGPITLAINSNDTFPGQASGTSFTVPLGSVAQVTTDAAVSGTWYVSLAQVAGSPTHFVGESIKMRGTTCPTGSLAEDGSAVSRAGTPALFAYLGTTWGAGDGSTTYNLPNSGGQFDREWVPGQSVDPGRTFGAMQVDAFQAFGLAGTNQYTWNGTTSVLNGTGGAAVPAAAGMVPSSMTNITATTGGTPRFTNETRPTNITVHSCIWTGQYQ